MNKKVVLFIFLLAGALVVGGLNHVAQALTTVASCTVVKVGPSGDQTLVWLIDNGTPNRFPDNTKFRLKPARAKELLAVALTAVSSGLDVSVVIDTSTTPDDTITAMYLKR